MPGSDEVRIRKSRYGKISEQPDGSNSERKRPIYMEKIGQHDCTGGPKNFSFLHGTEGWSTMIGDR